MPIKLIYEKNGTGKTSFAKQENKKGIFTFYHSTTEWISETKNI